MRRLALAPALALVACGGGSAPPDADEALACIASKRGQDYAVGLEPATPGAALDVKMMSADPAPPGFNNNTWVVQIARRATGAPVTGGDVSVVPFMPDHQHGTLPVKVQELPQGQYQLTPVNMWMPGYWEITIRTRIDAIDESVTYKFCIQA